MKLRKSTRPRRKIMKLMSMKQYGKMTKASLVRKIMKALKKMPKTKLVQLCYELEKRRLPTISTTKKNMPRLTARRAFVGSTPKRTIHKLTTPKGETFYKIKRQKSLAKAQRARQRYYFESKKPRSAKQLANDRRLGRMAKARAAMKKRLVARRRR